MVTDVARIGATAYYGGLRFVGAAALSRCLRDRGPVLCYHNVVAVDAERGGDLSLHMRRDHFAAQMEWMARHYDVLPLSEYVARIRAGRGLRSAAAVTFDDAYTGVFENALPVLRSFGLPATVFVVTSAASQADGFWWDHPAVVRAATPERRRHWLHELRGDDDAILADLGAHASSSVPAIRCSAGWKTIAAEARDGIEIGVHSASHRWLPALNDRELEDEVHGSRELLRRHTGITASLFAYPYGACDTRVAAFVAAAGYQAAFGLDSRNSRVPDVWAIRRVNIPNGISLAAFEAWTAGLRRPDP
jgi:peptidoglycan/xylan/chitin deacetylase (PgdA/CDA1 family)